MSELRGRVGLILPQDQRVFRHEVAQEQPAGLEDHPVRLGAKE